MGLPRRKLRDGRKGSRNRDGVLMCLRPARGTLNLEEGEPSPLRRSATRAHVHIDDKC